MNWEVVFYSLPSGKQPVLSWLAEQAPEVRAAFAHLFELLESNGTAMGEPHVKPLGKKLYELRVSGRDGTCLLYTSPSPRDRTRSRMPSSA